MQRVLDHFGLSTRKGLAGVTMQRVLDHFGGPERVYYAHARDVDELTELSGLARSSLKDKSMREVERILDRCDQLGIRVMTRQDAVYPQRLENIPQPPLVLYAKGRPISLDDQVAIAMVGTRSCTPYGERVAGKLAMELTHGGAMVVSGMAQGIDAASIRGALMAGGTVVSVLAGGLDVIYPRYHRFLYEDVAASGLLLSEYPPGTEHKGSHFPCGGGESPAGRRSHHSQPCSGPEPGRIRRARCHRRPGQRGHQPPHPGGSRQTGDLWGGYLV